MTKKNSGRELSDSHRKRFAVGKRSSFPREMSPATQHDQVDGRHVTMSPATQHDQVDGRDVTIGRQRRHNTHHQEVDLMGNHGDEVKVSLNSGSHDDDQEIHRHRLGSVDLFVDDTDADSQPSYSAREDAVANSNAMDDEDSAADEDSPPEKPHPVALSLERNNLIADTPGSGRCDDEFFDYPVKRTSDVHLVLSPHETSHVGGGASWEESADTGGKRDIHDAATTGQFVSLVQLVEDEPELIRCGSLLSNHHHHHLCLTSVVHASTSWTVSAYKTPPSNSIQNPFSMQTQFNQVFLHTLIPSLSTSAFISYSINFKASSC